MKAEKERKFLMTGEGGEEGTGLEPNHSTARKLGPLYIIQSSLVNIKLLKLQVQAALRALI
jgi:hypothetical protein